MENQFDVIVVGSYFNISWIASEIARQGWRVGYLDLNEALGRWPLEDIEGPFGYFSSDNMSPGFLDKLNNEESYISQDVGWTIISSFGPLEFKSPVIGHQLNKLGIDADFVQLMENSTSEYFKKIGQQAGPNYENFRKYWLRELAIYLSSAREPMVHNKAIYPLPLMNSFYYRWPNRRMIERNKQWLESQNIFVTTKTEILDVATSATKNILGLEVKGDLNGLVRTKCVVWGLSSEETYFYRKSLGEKMFPTGLIEPEWVWTRYTIEVTQDRETSQLPIYSVWVKNIKAPWTHENLMIFIRSPIENIYDVWMLIPNHQRFNNDYLKYYGERILTSWSSRFELSSAKIKKYPQEFDYTYKDLGPRRWGKFKVSDKAQANQEKTNKNVFLCSYQQWPLLNVQNQYQEQLLTIEKTIEALKVETVKELR